MDYKKKRDEAMSYSAYRELVTRLIEEGKSTGETQTERLLKFSKLNDHRMSRIDKTFKFEAGDTKAIDTTMKALVITEGWCGDAAQIVPVIARTMQELGLEVRFILRDDNLDLMDHHLTNGGRAIPIVVFLNEEFQVTDQWGPRPEPAQKIMLDHKNKSEPKETHDEIVAQLQLWYTRDKQRTMVQEWLALLSK